MNAIRTRTLLIKKSVGLVRYHCKYGLLVATFPIVCHKLRLVSTMSWISLHLSEAISSPIKDQAANHAIVGAKIQMAITAQEVCLHHAIGATMMVIPDRDPTHAIRDGKSRLLNAHTNGFESRIHSQEVFDGKAKMMHHFQ